MDLTIYNIIQGPVATPKAFKLNKNLNKLVLRVHPQANKPLVEEALEKLFNVKVKSIRIIVRKGKNRRSGKIRFTSSLSKKAIVTLAQGYSIESLGQAAGMPLETLPSASKD